MHYQERMELAKALRRHVREATTAEFDVDFKNYLLELISTFEAKGYNAFGSDEKNDFDDFLHHALT